MIVHLFPWAQAHTRDWISYISDNFTDEEHYIFVYGGKPDFENERKMCEIDKVWIAHGYTWGAIKRRPCYNTLMESLMKCDAIILHYASFLLLKRLLQFPDIIKKVRIVCWGGDIERLKDHQNFKYRVLQSKKVLLRSFSQVKRVGFLLQEDQEWVEKIIPNIKECSVVRYRMKYWKDCDQYYLAKKPKDDYYWIQLGNSATETNHHLEIIRKLAIYRGKPFKLYVPLSYGNHRYAKKVIKAGYKYLGEQFIPITDYMTCDHYYDLLSKMTIVIHNHHRQQGLGNIALSLQYGSKVYMNTQSPTWNSLVRQGYVLYDQKDIGKIPFESFVQTIPEALLANRERHLDEDRKYQINVDNWRQFFH